MAGMIDRGSLNPVTLRFLDSEVEDTYQREEGAAGLSGFRLIAGATILLWAVAAILIPIGTNLPASVTVPVGGSMALAGLACYSLSRWATTLNRQHVLASGLTSANGLVILILASVGDVVKGYAVGGIMLLFAYGFLARTRFVHAAVRTVVISIGLTVTVAVYDGPGSLLIDIFLFVTAALGTLLALRLLERDRRRVWLGRHRQHRLAVGAGWSPRTYPCQPENAGDGRKFLRVRGPRPDRAPGPGSHAHLSRPGTGAVTLSRV